MTERRDYEVGYKKPPAEHRFRPGQSGNRKGRPSGARSLATEVAEILNTPIIVTEGGKRRKVSTLKGVLLRLREKALKGDARAIDRFLALTLKEGAHQQPEQSIAELTAEDLRILNNHLEGKKQS